MLDSTVESQAQAGRSAFLYTIHKSLFSVAGWFRCNVLLAHAFVCVNSEPLVNSRKTRLFLLEYSIFLNVFPQRNIRYLPLPLL